MASPYAQSAGNLRDSGYSPMPVYPGQKVPGEFDGQNWHNLRQWSQWCGKQAPSFIHDKWERYPDAGVCIALGDIGGLDVDTDRADVGNAVKGTVTASPCQRRGAKGYMGYYRLGAGMEDFTGRVRWYDKDGAVVLELLLHGTQSVLPPTIHPETSKPYIWITEESLEDTPVDELPEITALDVQRLSDALAMIGVTRRAPKRVTSKDYDRPCATDDDLSKPLGRSINDRALEPDAIDKWWPDLDLPKSRQRGRGAWEGVAFWRMSNSGRAISDRNPNLRAIPSGIMDFGDDRSYTPIDVVMYARECSFDAAVEWLAQYVRAEEGAEIEINLSPPEPEVVPDPIEVEPDDTWASLPSFHSAPRARSTTKPKLISETAFKAQFPDDPPGFPISNPESDIPGGLGIVAAYLDDAAASATEAGGLSVALPLLGAVCGRAFETTTGLRTNVYTVALGMSGAGKTSLVKPAKELLTQAMLSDIMGQDRIASGSGLISMLTSNPRRVCFLDEFGHMLQQINSFNAGSHAKQIMSEFTSLYSAADTLYTGTAYASREPDPIDCPHLCIFGMATPDQFWNAFGSASLEDGSIARYLVMPIGDAALKTPDKSRVNDALKVIKDIVDNIQSTGNLGRPDARRVGIEDRAEAQRLSLQKTMSACAEYAEREGIKGAGPIMRRVAENAAKIALISAVARRPDQPEIDPLDFQIGHALALWSAQKMVASVRSHIADNQIEKDVNTVERKIEEAGKGGILQGVLKNRLRSIRKRDFTEIVEGLEDSGVIRRERFQTTKPGWRLTHAKFGQGKS